MVIWLGWRKCGSCSLNRHEGTLLWWVTWPAKTITALPLPLCTWFSLTVAKLLSLDNVWHSSALVIPSFSVFLNTMAPKTEKTATPLPSPKKWGRGEQKRHKNHNHRQSFLLQTWKHWVMMMTLNPVSEMWCPWSATSMHDCLWMSRKWTVWPLTWMSRAWPTNMIPVPAGEQREGGYSPLQPKMAVML